MDCVLISPMMVDKWMKKEYINKEAIGVQYLTASLKRYNIDYLYINAHAKRITNEEICDRLDEVACSFVGISCPSQRCYPAAKELIKLLRERGYKGYICMGGFYTTIAYMQIMEDISELDMILTGEGEYTLPSLITKLKNKKDIKDIKGLVFREGDNIRFSLPERILNLDDLPFPTRDIEIIGRDKEEFFNILAGRGCYGNCSFCSIIQFYTPRFKIYRSAKNVVDELEYLIKEYNIHYFKFNDEIFYDSSPRGLEWVNRFVDEVKNRKINITFDIEMRVNDITKAEILKLKDIGLNILNIGVESGVQRVLDEMNKNITVAMIKDVIAVLKECQVNVRVAFITIIPTMSFEELKQNYQFLFDLGCYIEDNLYNRLNIYTGCQYEEILRDKGLLSPKNKFYERHSYEYADPRVKLFWNFIKMIKLEILDVRKLIAELKENYDDDILFQIKLENFKEASKQAWTRIIKEILEKFDEYNEDIYLHEKEINNRIEEVIGSLKLRTTEIMKE